MKTPEKLPEIKPRKKDLSGNNQDQKPMSMQEEQSYEIINS